MKVDLMEGFKKQLGDAMIEQIEGLPADAQVTAIGALSCKVASDHGLEIFIAGLTGILLGASGLAPTPEMRRRVLSLSAAAECLAIDLMKERKANGE